MSRSTVFWGILLVVIGSLFLMDNLNIISIQVWQLIAPAFLILIGLWVLLGPVVRRRKTDLLNLSLDGGSEAVINLSFGAGKLRVGSGAGPGNLIEGSFDGGVNHKVRHQDGRLIANLDMPSVVFPAFPFFSGFEPFRWDVRLNGQIPIRLDANVGAADSTLDLTELLVTNLHFSTGASSTSIILPANAGSTEAVIKSGVASVNIQIPEGVAASIRATAGLGSVQVDRRRFPKTGAIYKSSGFEDAENRIELIVETGLGIVNIQ